jgi:hypothetical protein
MEERRKMSERRVNTPKQGLPLYYARAMEDRRQNNQFTAKRHWTEYNIKLITRCLTGNPAGGR